MSLSKRTHIMLDPNMFSWLQQKATDEGRTIGSLVRLILEKEYQLYEAEQKKEARRLQRSTQLRGNQYIQFWQTIQPLREKNRQASEIQYKELINADRRH